MRRRVLLLAIVASAAGVAAAAAVLASRGDGRAYRGGEAPSGFTLPTFALDDVSGRRVDSASLAGRAVLVTFLDSQCRAACPAIAAAVARGLEQLTAEERSHVTALAISTDPNEDTPAAVAAFLRRNRALGKLIYLVGSEREMRPVWREFMVLASTDTGNDELHSAPVRIYDARGRWAATQHVGLDLSPANLAHDLRLAAEG